jgi:hypothetical protein
MDHVKILKRAWAILWQYRVLWIFGIILAITTTSGSTANGSGYTLDSRDFDREWQLTPPDQIQDELEDFFRGLEHLPVWERGDEIAGTLIAIGIGLACVILLLIVVGIIARNVSEAALIRLVDDYEQTGQKRTFREGLRMGWSKAAVRLFLINLSAAIPIILAVMVLGTISLVPLLLWFSGNPVSGVFGTISTIGLGFLSILFFIVIGVAIKVLLHFVRRTCALENLGVIDAYTEGFRILRENLVPVLLMWLIMLGVQIGTTLLMIPIVLLSLLVSGVVSGLLFFIVRGLAGLFLSGAAMWIVSGAVALPFFILLLSIPVTLAGGLYKVYESTVWTLSYRELTVLKSISDIGNEDEEETVQDEVEVLLEDTTSEVIEEEDAEESDDET